MASYEPGGPSPDKREEIAIAEIRKALRGLKYGSVTVIVQDGVVVQIERTTKLRPDYSTDRVREGEGI
ncbi:MAG: YezD family protein [Armatimonadota bacterium]